MLELINVSKYYNLGLLKPRPSSCRRPITYDIYFISPTHPPPIINITNIYMSFCACLCENVCTHAHCSSFISHAANIYFSRLGVGVISYQFYSRTPTTYHFITCSFYRVHTRIRVTATILLYAQLCNSLRIYFMYRDRMLPRTTFIYL